MARATARQISFADVELMRQDVRLEPLLEAISRFLDSQHAMIERVRRDLMRGLKRPGQGRPGLTAAQVLRSLVLMRVKNWNYRELRERIADGVTLRQFTDFYCDPVPKHDAFNRGFNRLTPQTLKAVNDMVVAAAVALDVEDGAKLRVDTTVLETDIHHPTDNTLLWDAVRVVTRLICQLAKALELRCIKGFRNRRRSARRRMYQIQRMTTRQRQGAGSRQNTIYRELIGIAEEVMASARTALEKTAGMRGKDLSSALTIEAVRDEVGHYCGLGERVIDQARRRVLDGQQVPNSEKIYSIFEPHTDLIKRGKVRNPVEFGHKVLLAESAKGLITQYEVLKGNPADEVHVAPSLKRHCRIFRRAPELYGADRGFFSEQNVKVCVQSAPAVSYSIRQLEERLGIRLLNRTTRSVSLTDAGRRLVDRLRPAMNQISGALEDLYEERQQPVGRLRIRASFTATVVVAPVYHRFLSTYPQVQLELWAEGHPGDIVASAFDAGIGPKFWVPADMIAVRVSGPIRLAVVGAPAYFAARRPPRTPEDLTSHECVRYRMGANDALVAWLFERNGRTRRIPVTGRLTVNHPDLALRAALDGFGIACIPEGTAAPFLRTGELTRVLEGSSPTVEGLFIYYHGRRQVPVALRAFIDIIRGPKAARVT